MYISIVLFHIKGVRLEGGEREKESEASVSEREMSGGRMRHFQERAPS